MIIIHTPEGGEPERLNAGRLRASEIQIAESNSNRTWDELQLGLRTRDITTLRVLGWVIKKRTNPTLRLTAFDPFEDELAVKLDSRETYRYAAQLFAQYGKNPEDLAGAWEELREAADDPAVADAAIKEQEEAAAEGSPGPKAEASPSLSGSVTSETSTSSSSLSTSDSPPTTSTV
ncbi:hypothetical protein [Streptomyces sp. sk226]|uniref:hypothetical protein n=1 Tax=Streptomyces sp. sk226 TaxID=2034268 RepID=UPI000BF17139|nr:hypothetical protein [Streptomyces sp. sk226]